MSATLSTAPSPKLRYSLYHSFFQREVVFFYFQGFRKPNRKHLSALADRLDNVLSCLNYKINKNQNEGSEDWSGYLNQFCNLISHIRYEKGEHDMTYMMLFVLHRHFSSVAHNFIHLLLVTHGFWRDAKYLSEYVYSIEKNSDHPIIQLCVSTMNRQLYSDLRSQNYAVEAAPDTATDIPSNVAKWIPREHKKFDWLYTELVIHWFSTYCYEKVPFTMMKKTYRKQLSFLNTKLDTTQIKQCSRNHSEIVAERVTKFTFEKQPGLVDISKEYLQEKYNGGREPVSDDNILLNKKHGNQKRHHDMDLPISNYVKEAFSLLTISRTDFRVNLLNAKWERFSEYYIKTYFSQRDIIPMLDVSFSMQSDEETYYTGIGLAILLCQISSLGKRILIIDNMPTWLNLEGATTFLEMIDTFDMVTASSRSTCSNILAGIDIIAYSAQKTQTEYMLNKLHIVILSDFSNYENGGCTDLIDDVTAAPLQSSLHNSLIQRLQLCNNVVPNVTYWNLSKRGFVEFPCSIYQQKVLFLSGFSASQIKSIMKYNNHPYHGVSSILKNFFGGIN